MPPKILWIAAERKPELEAQVATYFSAQHHCATEIAFYDTAIPALRSARKLPQEGQALDLLIIDLALRPGVELFESGPYHDDSYLRRILNPGIGGIKYWDVGDYCIREVRAHHPQIPILATCSQIEYNALALEQNEPCGRLARLPSIIKRCQRQGALYFKSVPETAYSLTLIDRLAQVFPTEHQERARAHKAYKPGELLQAS